MCGFVGFYDENVDNREEIIKKMNDRIIHRGPDSDGFWSDDKVNLAFRRLSIIDLEGGSQPIINEDGSKIITFNGEIYNYQEIRKELLNKGHIFKTNSDTEVVLHGFEEYGEEILNKLRGMFAFVIYDKNKEEIFGARDFFGIKPFYYSAFNSSFLFGSEIKSFLDFPKFKKQVNKDALKMYLIFQYSVLDETFFKNVFKLKAGHFLRYNKKDGLRVKQYFDNSFKTSKKPFEEVKNDIKTEVEESVKYHEIADVEVGGFLSSGVDSSYIVSVAKPQKTFSVGFGLDGFDETVYAHDLSEMIGIGNKKKTISADEFFSALNKVQYHSDEPHANLSAVPLYFLSDMAAEDLKVVLSGEGADEFFGGYITYLDSDFTKAYKKLPVSLRHSLKKVGEKHPNVPGFKFLVRNGNNVEDEYIGQAKIMSNEEANNILSKPYKNDIRYQDITKPYFDKVKDEDDMTKKMYLDMNLWLPNDILLKADKMTMAHSLELRVPYLDRVLWSLAKSIPVKYRTEGKLTKFVFRKCAEEVLPEEWSKREKIGFPVPFVRWIKEEKYYNIVKETFQKDFVSDFFEKDKILKLLEDHYEGKGNFGRKIYTIFAFLIWYEEFFVNEK
ncbi:MAG: asparagine synthase (glutamine-hydrolyzing) [Oscillospiraceae bacterium]